LRVRNESKSTALGDRVIIADTSLARFVGLLGKKSLAAGCGLWIAPSNGIHTIGMMFAIDVILIDGECHVVGLRENLRPFRMTSLNWRARSVLELPVGTIQASRTEIGDHLSLEFQ
jgi:uncharacterized membrane protein (UPF0127 family)